jgi:hypothetical protein
MKKESGLAMMGNFPDGDAHTLATAHAIHADGKRHKAAREAAKTMAGEQRAKAEGMEAVARGAEHRARAKAQDKMDKVQRKYFPEKR